MEKKEGGNTKDQNKTKYRIFPNWKPSSRGYRKIEASELPIRENTIFVQKFKKLTLIIPRPKFHTIQAEQRSQNHAKSECRTSCYVFERVSMSRRSLP